MHQTAVISKHIDKWEGFNHHDVNVKWWKIYHMYAFEYENKNYHELLLIPVDVNDHYRRWVDQAFDWMRTVRKAWVDRTLPEKNYRSNSKICKTCPIRATCDEAGKGVVKINSLEPIDEKLSMV